MQRVMKLKRPSFSFREENIFSAGILALYHAFTRSGDWMSWNEPQSITRPDHYVLKKPRGGGRVFLLHPPANDSSERKAYSHHEHLYGEHSPYCRWEITKSDSRASFRFRVHLYISNGEERIRSSVSSGDSGLPPSYWIFNKARFLRAIRCSKP
jgi:hypothetical protein